MGEGSVPRKPHSFLHAQLLCCILLFVTLWTVAHQAPLSLGILQERTVEQGCHGLLQVIFPTRDQTQVSHVAGRLFTI